MLIYFLARGRTYPRLLSRLCWCHWISVFPCRSVWWWIYLGVCAENSSSFYHALPRCCLLYGVLRIQNDSKPVCVLLSTALVCVACKGLGAMWRLLDLLKHKTRTSYMQSSAVGQLHVGILTFSFSLYNIAVILSVHTVHTERHTLQWWCLVWPDVWHCVQQL